MKYLLILLLSLNLAIADYKDKGTDYSKNQSYTEIIGKSIFKEPEFFMSLMTALDYTKLNKGLQKDINISFKSPYEENMKSYLSSYIIERDNDNAPMVSKLWLKIDENSFNVTVFLKHSITKEANGTNPYGEFTIDYAVYNTLYKDINTINTTTQKIESGRIKSEILNDKNIISATYNSDNDTYKFYLEKLLNEYKAVSTYIDRDDNSTGSEYIVIPQNKNILFYKDIDNSNISTEKVYNMSKKPIISDCFVLLFNEDGSDFITNIEDSEITCSIPDTNISTTFRTNFKNDSITEYKYYNYSSNEFNSNVFNFNYSSINNTINCDINGLSVNKVVKKFYDEKEYPEDTNANINDAIFLDADDSTLYPAISQDNINSIGLPKDYQ